MPVFIALLRGINVGGSGLLPMQDLARLCAGLGFDQVRTYIQSGNVVFKCGLSERSVQTRLEKTLETKMGKKVDVMVRTGEEMRQVLSGNPFPNKQPARVAVAFLSNAPPSDLLTNVVAPGGEQVRPGKREVYVYYPDGMGRSRLKLPLKGAPATVRNINTVARLAAMAQDNS